jgi:hypothetical protein
MPKTIRQSDLEGYLDEALPAEQMARIEKALRKDRKLAQQAAAIHARRCAGVHSLGEIWRAGRLSCPSREQLGSYLLGALPQDAADYVCFHVEQIGCRYCRANLGDLQAQQTEKQHVAEKRRRKYYQSSAGYLRPQ